MSAPPRLSLSPVLDARLTEMLGPFRHAVLAVSGGPDSMALMVLVARWLASGMAPATLSVAVATVDHRLRAESAREADWVAEQARAEAEIAKAAGDEAKAAKAEALAAAMQQAAPEPVELQREVIADDYLEIARSLERGVWIEFEADDGQLAFAKLAWVSPLRGTYLFTNRQGQKALSMTAEDLADRFRADRARVVEAEPLIDRAFSSMISQIEERLPEAETVE